jgi:hypothetical protein
MAVALSTERKNAKKREHRPLAALLVIGLPDEMLVVARKADGDSGQW